MRGFLVGFLALAIFAGCAEKIVTECEPDPNLAGGQIRATFGDIQEKLFTPTCAIAGCHAGAAPVLGLDLSAGQSYQNLVNVPSVENSVLKRVTPGNSAASFLVHKLQGLNTTVMPPSGRVSKSVIDSIEAWIDAGALQNGQE